MPTPPRLRWEIVLSHSLPKDLHRCIEVSLWGTNIHLCIRCLGLYPALITGLATRLELTSPDTLSSPFPEWADLTIRLIVPFAGAAAWGVEQVGVQLSKAARLTSGALIGVGAGWVLGLHLRQPWPDELVELSIAFGLVLLLGLLGRWTRLTDEADEIEAELPGGRKKTDDPDKNEVDPRAS